MTAPRFEADGRAVEATLIDGPTTPLDPNRVLCRYCARTLTVEPLTPRETAAHCGAQGCRVCGECARGETSVSPVRPTW